MASNTETMRSQREYIDKNEGETLDNKTLNQMAWKIKRFYKHHLTMKECKLVGGYIQYFQDLRRFIKIKKIYQHQ